jgi:hypothetical protein
MPPLRDLPSFAHAEVEVLDEVLALALPDMLEIQVGSRAAVSPLRLPRTARTSRITARRRSPAYTIVVKTKPGAVAIAVLEPGGRRPLCQCELRIDDQGSGEGSP